jgi:selenide, water dikinase
LGPAQLTEVLRQLPKSVDPNLIVGFDTKDDAGVFRLSETQALVQTLDFFTPVVDEPYSYGAIAAANALSDVYAMGGRPITVMNIACFDPTMAPPEIWAAILKGAYDKTTEAGAIVVGGHSVEDSQPKFGLSVTGVVDPKRVFKNTEAKAGDSIYLTKPLGTGIVTTAAKNDAATDEELGAAIDAMSTLNAAACEAGLAAGVRCATDITGFGIAGHLYNVARASGVRIELDSKALPLLPGVERLIAAGMTTGGGAKNAEFVGPALQIDTSVSEFLRHLVVDPQTSGGLALFSTVAIPGATLIGTVQAGSPAIVVR